MMRLLVRFSGGAPGDVRVRRLSAGMPLPDSGNGTALRDCEWRVADGGKSWHRIGSGIFGDRKWPRHKGQRGQSVGGRLTPPPQAYVTLWALPPHTPFGG
jgi:hypothetical protein